MSDWSYAYRVNIPGERSYISGSSENRISPSPDDDEDKPSLRAS